MPRPDHFLISFFVCLALGWAALVLGVNGDPSRYLSSEYAMWAEQGRAARESEPTPVLVLGDSRTMGAIDPTRIDRFESYSLALGGTTPIEAYYQLEDYMEYHPAPRVLMVGFAPYHLMLHDTFWDRTVKFRFLDRARYDELFGHAVLIGDATLGRPTEISSELESHAKFDRFNAPVLSPVDFSAEILASFFLRAGENRSAAESVRAGRGFFLFGRREQNSGLSVETGWDVFEPAPLLDFYLGRLLDLAESHGIAVVWFTLPINATSYAALTPEFSTSFDRYLDRLQSSHPALLAHSGLWSLPDDHFGDESHVNDRGAVAATAKSAAFVCERSELIACQPVRARARSKAGSELGEK